MLNVIFTRMEMQAMEAEILAKDESEIHEPCDVDEIIQSDDLFNQDIIDDQIIEIINELCDSTIQSFDCDTKTKELAQDIVRSMSQVNC